MPSIDPTRLKTAERARTAAERLAAATKKSGKTKPPATARAGHALRMTGAWLGYTARRVATAPGRWLDLARARSGHVQQPPPGTATPGFLVVGHRGSPKRRVENTIDAMEHAVEVEHANALEIDLSMTKDGEIVLWHDWEPNDLVALARQLGIEPNQKFAPDAPNLWDEYRRPTDELTLAELREHFGYKKPFLFWFSKRVEAHIPTLSEFYEWAKAQPRLKAVFLDIKMPERAVHMAKDFALGIQSVIDAFEPDFASICMSTKGTVIDAMREHAPELKFTHDVEVAPGIVNDTSQYSAIRNAIDAGHPYASVGRPALTLGAWRVYQEILQADVERMREHNQRSTEQPIEALIGWTINTPSEAKRMIQLGVHGILTDQPRKLRQVAEKLGRKLA